MQYTSIIDILTDAYEYIQQLRESTEDLSDRAAILHYEMSIDLLRQHAEREGI